MRLKSAAVACGLLLSLCAAPFASAQEGDTPHATPSAKKDLGEKTGYEAYRKKRSRRVSSPAKKPSKHKNALAKKRPKKD